MSIWRSATNHRAVPLQRTLGEIDITDIRIDVRSRDEIPLILLGLQHLITLSSPLLKPYRLIKSVSLLKR